MNSPHESELPGRMNAARFKHVQAKETLARLKELEAEVSELVTRLRWQMYLGYDQASVEFLKKLDLRH